MMRCKAVRIFSLLLLVLLVSCRVETPKNILSQGKMGEVLYDYHLARALIDKEHYAGYYKEKLVYRAVFEKHGITKEMFDSSLVWYNRHPKQMVEVYKGLESRIKNEQASFALLRSARVDGVDLDFAHLGSNISELWTSHNVKMLSAVPLNNKLAFSFVTPKDSTFMAGDSLSFSFNVKFISQNRTDILQQAFAAINYEYNDKTTGAHEVIVDSPGHYELYVPRNYGSRLKSMDGYVYYYDNDTVGAARMIISDISLRRLHPRKSSSD
ncbi:MAG: DUF4296 domain-containing protein [Bacteroidaceae bacterium]|nr:DUF4296 domain-containing protein [Bacteroidaceae bacterium]